LTISRTDAPAYALAAALCCIAVAPPLLHAQTHHLSAETGQYVTVDTPVLALRHVRVVDGTGAPPRDDQTVIVTRGLITAVGDAGSTAVPTAAQTLDLAGRTVMPGLVMVHEHMFYPTGGVAIYNEHGYSFPRLYLAGGATTIRTAGSMEPYTDLNLRTMIDTGAIPGPKIDVTGPYLEGPGLPLYQVHMLTSPTDAADMVRYWADHGVTSFKSYMHSTRAELAAAIAEAHRRGLKVTGHLCSVTFREAAELGIDNLEHGLLVASDFVRDKQPDVCPAGAAVPNSIAALDVGGEAAAALIRDLVAKHVAVTSTLAIYETFVPHRPPVAAGALEAMTPEARIQYLQGRARIGDDTASQWTLLLRKEMDFERAYAAAGGLLLAGSDPTGYGGVVPGYSNRRQIELLVEAGFTPVDAIKIATLNGARYLGRAERVGSIATGKAADLLVVRGDPTTRIRDIENGELVFKDGVGYDVERLLRSARSTVGLH
jgi:imidazolonepropionase-like amidohydrolase